MYCGPTAPPFTTASKAKSGTALAALLLLSCSQSAGGTPDIEVKDAWARATTAGKSATAAYLTITNRGTADDALLAVTSASGTAQVHSTSTDGGIMRMRPLERLPVPSGETVKLAPGGTHVMLTGLKAPLAAGDRVEMTLRFERSGERIVAAAVQSASGAGM